MLRNTARSSIWLADEQVHKLHTHPRAGRAEIEWYLRLDGLAYTPKLLSYDLGLGALLLQRCPTAAELGAEAWHPYQALRVLLRSMQRSGFHHRDVHARNVVRLPSGEPALIDWETAITGDCGCYGYDFGGPCLHIPRPEIHRGRYWMSWDAPHPMAMGRFWSGYEEC